MTSVLSNDWKALVARGAAFLLIMTTGGAIRAEEPEALTARQIASVMRCMLPQARGEGWQGDVLQARYYQPEQLLSYGKAIRRSVQVNGLPERYVAIFIGTLYQQSKFQYDAVSRHNRGDDGEKLEPREDAWIRPQDGMDYGIFQLHWPMIWTPSLPPWNGKRKPTLAELKDPLTNILIAGEWFKRKGEMCELMAGARTSAKACQFDASSLTCRCLRTKEATGGWWVNGNPASIGAIMTEVDRCIAVVREQGET